MRQKMKLLLIAAFLFTGLTSPGFTMPVNFASGFAKSEGITKLATEKLELIEVGAGKKMAKARHERRKARRTERKANRIERRAERKAIRLEKRTERKERRKARLERKMDRIDKRISKL